MNWFMPALVSRRPDSGGGINEDEGTRRCSRSSKKRRNVSRIAAPSIGKASLPGVARPAPAGLLAQEPHRHHCAGDPRAEAERDPEDPPHRYLFLPPKRLEAFFRPPPHPP